MQHLARENIGSQYLCDMCDSEPLNFKKSSNFSPQFAVYKYHSGHVMEDGLEGKETKFKKTSYKMIAAVKVEYDKSQYQTQNRYEQQGMRKGRI